MEYKSPTDVLTYVVDWTNEMGGSTVSTSVFVVPAGITKDSDSKDTTTATIVLSGGTVGLTYDIKNTITTAAGETIEKHFFVRVKDRLVG